MIQPVINEYLKYYNYFLYDFQTEMLTISAKWRNEHTLTKETDIDLDTIIALHLNPNLFDGKLHPHINAKYLIKIY
jgi:hypothetical protein